MSSEVPVVPALRHPPTTAPDAARLHSARWGVMGLFFILGVLLSTFISRVPSIAELLDVTPGQLAVLGLFGAIGAFLALMVTGWSVARFGSRALILWSSFTYLAAFALLAWSTTTGSHVAFATAQFFVSFSFAFTNVPMNAEAAAVERGMKRAVMPQFHAGFSVGMAAGLGLGAVLSHLGVAPVWHFLGVASVLTLVRLAIIPLAVMDGMPSGTAATGLGGPFATARDEYRDRRVILIGVIVFSASTIEGAAAQWSSLAVVTGFGKTEAIGDLFYWGFVIAMVTTRGLGATIIGRLGRVVALRTSAVLAILGVLIFALTPWVALAPVGMVLWGLGAGLGVPIGFSAASDKPESAASRVAAVSSFATIAGLVMPQVIGHLGDAIGLRHALLVACLAGGVSFAVARAVRSEGPLFRSRARVAKIAARRADELAEQRSEQRADRDEAAVLVADAVEPMQPVAGGPAELGSAKASSETP